ncbi:MAG: putative zinc metalloprotease [Chlamydiae bacterium]|nr:putative zinc metalloprotease [Chlamydiota bacterium]
MVQSILYILLSLLGIGFLIFIHELGHYFMGKRAGVTIEVFSIGLGKAIAQWERNGVKWKLGWIPIGGYVQFAGTAKEGNLEPHQVKGGLFAAKPWDRIKIAAMGPIVNILFALLAFSFLWVMGGREKPFAEFTDYVGWVQRGSGPYETGIRPGDRIQKVNGKTFNGFNDFLYRAMLDKRELSMTGDQIDYATGRERPFTYIFPSTEEMSGTEKATLALSSMSAAQYLLYDKMSSGAPNELFPGSPLEGSGIAYGDRIIWVDGELVFSKHQLVSVLNHATVLLGIEREGKTFLTQVPRLNVSDLRLSPEEKAEIDDWRTAEKLSTELSSLTFIPYNLNAEGVVESPLRYIDEESEARMAYEGGDRIPIEEPLLPGDRIISVQGERIGSSSEFLKNIQTKKTLVIVKKVEDAPPPLWTDADKGFASSFDVKHLEAIAASIGTQAPITTLGQLKLLAPVTPVPFHEFPYDERYGKTRDKMIDEKAKAVEETTDPKRKEAAARDFQLYQNRLMLGLVLQDTQVRYNPNPFVQFGDVFKETYRTLYALFTGYLSPKVMAGPIGIIQVVHHSWGISFKEAIFWLGMISLNLGLLNLLPIPVLDGGQICFSIYEGITKKPLKMKTMERLIIPFWVLIIAYFVYVTYNDLVRIITNIF